MQDDFNPDEFLAQVAESSPIESNALPAAVPPEMQSAEDASDFDPDQFLSDMKEDKYGSVGQQALTAVEGASQGVLGPIAPLIQTEVLGMNPEDIRAREEVNPLTHGVSETAALVGSSLSGVGLGGVMTKGAKAASALSGMAKATEGVKAAEMAVQAAKVAGKGVQEAQAALKAAKVATPLSIRVGDEVVRQAAEMAIMSSGDEVSKMILRDPEQTAETAISNIGIQTLLGGAGGAFMTGVASPLWEATASPRIEAALNGFKDHLNGGRAVLPDDLKSAESLLGVEIAPELRAAMSGNKTAANSFGILREGQNTKVLESLKKFDDDVSTSVAQSLRVSPEDVAVYSENQAGHDILDTFKAEYGKRYGPVAEAMEKRNKEAANILISDEARLMRYEKLIKEGMDNVGTDSPAYKLYNDWGNRVLAKETVGGLDMLKTELQGEITKASRAGDTNALKALRDIRTSIADFQEGQIVAQAGKLEAGGVEGAKKLGADLLNERAEANRMYREFAEMSGELTDHLGVGQFTGAKTLTGKLTDKVSAEQLLNKFSIKGNADFIPFLQKNFPEVYEKVRENELKRLIKPAVLSAKGESPINIKKLNDIIDKNLSGQKEYIEAILDPESIAKIQAANKLSGSIPTHRSSGTAGWMTKMFQDMPRSALAAVGALTGGNPLIGAGLGAILGETAQRLGRDAPDAIRLAHLRFIGASEPTSAKGFKAMVDFLSNTYKGEQVISKASKAVFQRGVQVLSNSQIPDKQDREKLDKLVTKSMANPEGLLRSVNGETGYYLPQHQTALASSSAAIIQYLQQIKPQPHVIGIMNKDVPPLPEEVARYNRALDIATTPAIVLEHVKNGTIMESDLQDINSMYPKLYTKMVNNLTNEMVNAKDNEDLVPYHTKIGISMFIGQPIDASMEPEAIVAAQPLPQAPPPPSTAQPKRKTSAVGKTNSSYMTSAQSAEANRRPSSRD